ncbi:MAG: phytanoyl-CoA dioxygenase family protein [Candidatus Latescibacteria bacterium]|nr:phytanoyl-CoA dioxygenase family protein [Candidatus Latescibacterota bacterium]
MRKITDAEIRFFDENGYAIIRGVLQDDELANFQKESQRLIDEVVSGGPAAPWCIKGPEGIPFYLTYLHVHPNSFSLRLLAHPFIGDLLTRMVGPDFIPCYESLVFKLPGHGSSVPWHRDGNPVQGSERIFNIDIYPDKSTVENSCVWVVPGSHLWEKERANEMIARGRAHFDLPDAVPAEMEPGDVLLHHTKVMHGSTMNHSPQLRRVIYFDNRSFAWNRKYRWWTDEFVDLRCRLYLYALFQRKTNPYPLDDEVFDYQVPDGAPVWKPGDPIDLHASREGREANRTP